MDESSIFGVVALGIMAVMTPAILDVDVSGDATADTVLQLLSPFGLLIGLAFFVAAMGLLVALFTDSGGY